MKKAKQEKLSAVDFNKKYFNNPDACEEFFFHAKYPNGFYCEKCGCIHYRKIPHRNHAYQCTECQHQEYLFSGTIFQDNKLDLYILLYGLFLFFNSTKGISAKEMQHQLGVNYKTALLLCRKCRVLMSQSCEEKVLDSLFYEADVAYFGSESKEPGHQGLGTEKQAFFVVLSTGEDNSYPQYIKIQPISKDNGEETEKMLRKSIKMSKDRTLNTDGKTTFNIVSKEINVVNEKIDYKRPDHRLHWLNIFIGNIKNNIVGIYHGVSKRDLPLFLKEQEYRINHRRTGMRMMDKIQKYILNSVPMTRKTISNTLDSAIPVFC